MAPRAGAAETAAFGGILTAKRAQKHPGGEEEKAASGELYFAKTGFYL
jgi:hypothetical protein